MGMSARRLSVINVQNDTAPFIVREQRRERAYFESTGVVAAVVGEME